MSDSFDPSAPAPIDPLRERPMEDFAAPPPDAPPIEIDGLVEASEELASRRRAEIEPMPVEYKSDDLQHRRDQNETVTPERAAKDLADLRNRVDDARNSQQAEIDAASVDLLKNERITGLTPQQQIEFAEAAAQAQAAQRAQPVEQQPTQQELPEGVDPELARVLTEHPKVREALAAEVSRINKAEQVHYEATKANAAAAFGALLAFFPELQNISSAEELKVGIKLINQQNPQRASQIISHIEQVQNLGRQAAQAEQTMRQRQQQEYQRQWSEFAAREDALFNAKAPELQDAAKSQEIGKAAVETLRSYGISNADVERLWKGEASLSLRDHRAQLILRDAALYRAAKATLQQHQARPIPPVQRPGVTSNHVDFNDQQLGALNNQLTRSQSYKDAAKLLIARRSGKGR